MKQYKADLHIHSVLSPCGDLDASPSRIIAKACQSGIDILGISDHNCIRHARLMMELGEEYDIFILPGIEINTQEEIHCLAFFENADIAEDFQGFIDANLPAIKNESNLFGQQLVVDRYETIIDEVEVMLASAIEASIYKVSEEVYKRNGIFIPAHIDRPYTSVISQLGFVPSDLKFDALEVSARSRVSDFRNLHPELGNYTLITNSDAHHPDAINRATTLFEMKEISFTEIKHALKNTDGRKTDCR
jgi:3',5'-nucleoside bisphosphate phosphatase